MPLLFLSAGQKRRLSSLGGLQESFSSVREIGGTSNVRIHELAARSGKRLVRGWKQRTGDNGYCRAGRLRCFRPIGTRQFAKRAEYPIFSKV